MSMNRPKRALVTGATGQDGSYLIELLLSKGYEVWGIIRRSSSFNTSRIEHLCKDAEGGSKEDTPENRLHICYGDLADSSSLNHIMKTVRPDEVYNLAAQSHVQVSFEIPEYTGDVTGLGAVRLLEAMRQAGLTGSRFYQASSSELYGKVAESPQNEKTPFYPRSPYGAAKAYAFHITRNYRESYDMFAVNGILFNHESPRRGDNFVTRKISRAAARISLGQQKELFLGNLEAKRDWGFAGDYVYGMWLMLQAEKPKDYVLATGKTCTVRDFVNKCFQAVDMPLTWHGSGVEEQGRDREGNVIVQVDPKFFRPTEVDLLLGDASLAKKDLGWEPKVSLEQLAVMMVENDLKIAHQEANETSKA